VDDRYPTLDEYHSVCSGPELVIDDPTGSFSGDVSQWSVSGHARFNCVNEADAELDASVVRNSDNSTVSSATPWTLNWAQYRPTFTEQSISPTVSTSTMNNTCGITGEGRWSVHATVTLLDYTWWHGGEDKPAPQSSLAGCQPVPQCGTEIINDGSCDDGGTGGPSAGGGNDGSGNCTEWAVYEEISYDGGVTWEFDGIDYYYWVC
jgi:hypothetical protein